MLCQSYIDLGGVLQTVHQNKIEHGEMTEQIQMPRRECQRTKIDFQGREPPYGKIFLFYIITPCSHIHM